jgi:hypothetical protein
MRRLLWLLVLIVPAVQAGTSLTWGTVTETVTGEPLEASNLYYNIYYQTDGSGWLFGASTPDTTVPLDSISSGCFDFRVTAVRTDTGGESEPSNQVSWCAGAALEKTDPINPKGVRIEQT